MSCDVVLLVATFRLLELLAFVRQLKNWMLRYILLVRIRVHPTVFSGRQTGHSSGGRTAHSPVN